MIKEKLKSYNLTDIQQKNAIDVGIKRFITNKSIDDAIDAGVNTVTASIVANTPVPGLSVPVPVSLSVPEAKAI
jgi:predicted nucleotidyltransferase